MYAYVCERERGEGGKEGRYANYCADAPPILGMLAPPTTLVGQKRRQHSRPLADGYNIALMMASETAAVRSGEVYTPEETFGRYLDLVPIYKGEVRNMRYAFTRAVDKSCVVSSNQEVRLSLSSADSSASFW